MNFAGAFIALGKKILIHSLFWLVILLFFTFFFGLEGADFKTIITFSAFFLPVTMGTTYVFIYTLIPNYLIPKRYFQFTFYTLAAFLISASYITLSAFYGIIMTLGYGYREHFPLTKSLIYILISVYLIVAVASAFSLLRYNYAATAKNEELKNKILEAQLSLKEQELQYLKMQLHPHFLFNTLNTIYGLSLSSNSCTAEMILQLSELLDYILYQTKKPFVNLQDEINHIKNYISLEEKRFQDALEIDFVCEPIPSNIALAPMLLLPFVENSFKHGNSCDGILRIAISLTLENKNLHFKILNSVSKNSEIETGAGIGLKNIQRRLELLYEGHFQLNTSIENEMYCVNLLLDTAKTPKNAS